MIQNSNQIIFCQLNFIIKPISHISLSNQYSTITAFLSPNLMIPQTDQTQLKNFLPLSKLGQGAFSTVYKVKRITDGQIYALKKIKMQKLKPKEQQNSLNQIRILASIKSKFIISYKEAFYDQSLNLLCIVMEYANGGDLQKVISDCKKANKNMSEQKIWKAASEILIGLYILHEKGILHRDLKSANVFISNDVCKLGDLNVSKISYEKDLMARTQTGTPYYASPQVWRDEPYDSKCDIWSFGCLIYQLCCFQPPFQGADLDQLFKSVQRGKYKEISNIYSSELSSLIKACLKVDPKQRLSAKQLIDRFHYLNEQYSKNKKSHQIENQSILINTIRLPLDLKDLGKNLPSAEYEFQIKQQQLTLYPNQEEKKQTVMLKNKAQVQKQKALMLPERIKGYFNSNNKYTIVKRPERPLTAQKKKQFTELRKKVRPLSAYHVESQGNQSVNSKFVHEVKNQNFNKRLPPTSAVIKDKIETNQKRTIPISQKSKILQKPASPLNKQYRCKSSEYQKRFTENNNLPVKYETNQMNQVKKINTPNKTSSKKIPLNIKAEPHLNNVLQQQLAFNNKKYQECKQNCINKISSLQKKVKYIRQQRKQRKQVLQKIKENMSCILKPSFLSEQASIDIKQRLKQKINQNSQILQPKAVSYQKRDRIPIQMPVIKENQIGSQKSILRDKSHIFERNHYEIRKPKQIYLRKYVMSADRKRVRSSTQSSRDHNQTVNQASSLQRRSGMIRLIPSRLLPNIAPSQKVVQPLGQKTLNIIDDSETILRLKRRIKNRIIGHGASQRQTKNNINLNSQCYR